jgi:hypothetical protein
MTLRDGTGKLLLASWFLVLVPFLGLACGSSGDGDATGKGGAGGGGSARGGRLGAGLFGGNGGGGADDLTVGSGGGCVNLECQQVPCADGAATTVSGVVYAPEGKTPLYNVVVYVPNASVLPFPAGASCDKCGSVLSGDPIVTAITDTKGRFKLENVPVGSDIPIVIQVGKWRRQITVPAVVACQDNPISDPDLTRLPRNHTEGDMPQIALTTGGADPLECLLRKIGIDDQEFSTAKGAGRVHLYRGAGGAGKFAANVDGGQTMTYATELWNKKDSLMQYDVVLLACEGNQNPDEKPPEALQALFDYTSSGGRVFASHWNNYWLESGPNPFPKTAVFDHQPDLPDPIMAYVDTSFPKGQALADWLLNVGASKSMGQIQIKEAQHTVDMVNSPISQRWIYQPDFESIQYFTFNTPIAAAPEDQCGRMVFSDIHVASGDSVGQPFPIGCVTSQMSPQEKALLFMLFDLSSCILPDDTDPGEPPG